MLEAVSRQPWVRPTPGLATLESPWALASPVGLSRCWSARAGRGEHVARSGHAGAHAESMAVNQRGNDVFAAEVFPYRRKWRWGLRTSPS